MEDLSEEAAGETRRERAAVELARRIAQQRGLEAAGQLLGRRSQDLVRADAVRCLVAGESGEDLQDVAGGGVEGRYQAATNGLVGSVFRTGRALRLERLTDDRRYEAAVDAPGESPDSHLLAVPLLGPRARVVGVLEAVRAPHHGPFSAADEAALRSIGEHAGVPLHHLSVERALLHEALPPQLSSGLFRPEALRRARAGMPMEGDPLRASARWMLWLYPLLITLVAGCVLFSALAKVTEYAAGPAVVQLGNLEAVTAESPGTVARIEVAPGQSVESGQVLARFNDAPEAADFERVDREFKLHLLQRLREPLDAVAEQALTTLRPQRDLALKRLEERIVRSPVSGTVNDVRMRPGQYVTAGQSLFTLVTKGSQPSIVALFPGRYRPYLRAGMPVRFQLQGARYDYRRATVLAVGGDVLGPAEARRQLGEGIADAAPIEGPVVLVRAAFVAAPTGAVDPPMTYYDGMWGRAQVPIRSERLLLTLIPGGEDGGG